MGVGRISPISHAPISHAPISHLLLSLRTSYSTISRLTCGQRGSMLVYEKLGVACLRQAWLNLNVVWAAALFIAGVLALV